MFTRSVVLRMRATGRNFLSRSNSTLSQLEPIGKVAPAVRVLRMCKRPVNSLSLEMLESLAKDLNEAESDPECRAVVLASAVPGIFSAGLDIEEMHNPDPDRLHAFWTALQEVWIRLSSSKVATVAAIEGHSPAGGCLLSISCDWRIMSLGLNSKPFTIGLNETKLGIVAPTWFAETFSYVIGPRHADIMLQTGALVGGQEALAIGLIDELVQHDEVMERAVVKTHQLLSVPDAARHASKMMMRRPMVDRLLAKREEDTATFSAFCFSAPVQKSLAKYMEALRQRKAK